MKVPTRYVYFILLALGVMLASAGCAGQQLVIERVITATPDPNVIMITITATPASVASAPTEPAPTSTDTAIAPTNTTENPTAVTITPAPPTTVAPTPTLSAFPTETRQEIFIAQQSFEKGYMFWIQARRIVWVLIIDDSGNPNIGQWRVYQDTFEDGVDQEDATITAPEGRYVPRRGFGKLWQTTPGLRDALGWGITPEFALNTPYVYQPGGFLDNNGKYVQGPGKHFITTLGREVFALSEPDESGIARWQRIK